MEPYHLQSSSFLQRITIMSTVRHLVYNVFTPQVSSANHNQIRYNQTELHRASGRFHIWIVQPTLLAPPRRLATPVGPPTSCWLIEDDVDIRKKHYRKISKYSNSHVVAKSADPYQIAPCRRSLITVCIVCYVEIYP